MDTVCYDIIVPEAIPLALRLLRDSQLVVLPTDTVYGLGAHAFLEGAVERLYQVKERPGHVPIPLLMEDAKVMSVVCAEIPPLAWRLAEAFWPGGLTLILYRLPSVSPVIAGGGDKIAVRVPDHPVPLTLIRLLGRPITGTSANLTGSPNPLTAEDVRKQLGDSINLVIDGGKCSGNIASTVIDLTTHPPVILRQGTVSRGDIESVCAVSTKEA